MNFCGDWCMDVHEHVVVKGNPGDLLPLMVVEDSVRLWALLSRGTPQCVPGRGTHRAGALMSTS